MSFNKVIFFASYVLASVFMLVVLTSHPSAANVLRDWWTFYTPMAFVTGLPLGYVLYRGLLAAIATDK